MGVHDYPAKETDSYWFKSNEIEGVKKYISKSELKDIPEGLLEALYLKNRISQAVTWRPIMVTVEFLPGEYTLETGERDHGINCLVSKEQGNVGVYSKNKDKAYRSFFTISKVAFTKDSNFAILKLGKHCAPLSGAGEWLLALQKHESQWKVIGGLTFWIS